ncbi:glycosyl hydrolase family 28-related protein [Chryseobacterium sp. BLS98]|uniref:glycosyl hydrolase family 28-related protein n=1 Tax=Chryseobacterium sp. BLS98 TaxID=885586 RepID=UPI000AB6C2E6|nr:glycosyl hydrolase family 28-related protein [Chryseobacterium sp. BLS98]
MKTVTLILILFLNSIGLSGQILSVKEFNAKGDGITDDTKAIQNALNSGKPIRFEQGVYLVRTLVVPYNFKGLSMEGVGFNHWHNDVGTVLKSIGNEPILKFVDGCDWVKISNLRLDGNNIGGMGIDGTFGGGLIIDNVGFYNFQSIGLKSRQGLLRISNSFFFKNKVGVELFSDSTITNTEITGGDICLKIVAGGNRLSNIWLNSAHECLLLLKPLDEKTGHQNTSITNAYIGELLNNNGREAYQIRIEGNAIKRVQQIQITNSFFVHATDTKSINSFFYLNNCDEIIISNSNFLGRYTYYNKNSYTKNFVVGENSNNIKIIGNIVKGINQEAVIIKNGAYDWSILNNDFIDCAGLNNVNAVIKAIPNSRSIITNNKFLDYRNTPNVVALQVDKSEGMLFKDNYIYYPNKSIIIDSKNVEISQTNNYR